MALVAVAAHGLSTLELNNRLLDTMRSSLHEVEPELRELYANGGDSTELSKWLSQKINTNQELVDALASTGKAAPRFIGALVLGATQVLTDVVKMGLTRY